MDEFLFFIKTSIKIFGFLFIFRKKIINIDFSDRVYSILEKDFCVPHSIRIKFINLLL